MPAIKKWFPMVLVMKKVFNQCWLGLKQPKIGEKCHCYGTFKPLFSILTRLGNFQIKGGQSGDVGFFTSKYEKTHAKVDQIGLHSPGNEIYTPYFPRCVSKTQEMQVSEEKNDWKC